ncbi:eukaryotic translation initiation factor 2-alpha kinase 1-like [Oppia nitens]|uniref:eukaryotic translation initiation factor 2-alpha kinase 1-like n=1 Tax=Oppia nitens TaxID=1686743 RepID=UPI0023D9B839|nr:eukaryotic translation initiation factor 2-alpha kinase 1-like [Oppia nitens]
MDLVIDWYQLNNEFEPVDILGTGTFGQVVKAKYLPDKQFYAIKAIHLAANQDPKYLNRELEVLHKVSNVYLVKYHCEWSEILPDNSRVTFIQMELCWFTLKDGVDKMRQYFRRQPAEMWPPLGYYMAVQLFRELLTGINYLHSRQPPIIHRDIKPTNILIRGSGCLPDRPTFIKIADFGLAIEHHYRSQSHTRHVGTDRYMAPEVNHVTKYTITADMYSIGVTSEELFNYNVNDTR